MMLASTEHSLRAPSVVYIINTGRPLSLPLCHLPSRPNVSGYRRVGKTVDRCFSHLVAG